MSEKNGQFRKIIENAKPILLREPLAKVLGAFEGESDVVEYSFKEVVKLAGHPCPTIAGAYLCCKKALEKLYDDEIPIRGDISIKVYGRANKGVYGVISQVFSFITGAASSTGFHGLGNNFVRKDLLSFEEGVGELEFNFKRNDNGKSVVVKLLPQNIPFRFDKAQKMGELMGKVLWDSAKPDEKKEFHDLWMEKIEIMLNEKEIGKWLVVSRGKDE